MKVFLRFDKINKHTSKYTFSCVAGAWLTTMLIYLNLTKKLYPQITPFSSSSDLIHMFSTMGLGSLLSRLLLNDDEN